MKSINSISLILAFGIIFTIFIVYGDGRAADNTPANPQRALNNASASGGASSELAGRYSLEILAPANIPVKTLYIKDPKGKISATMDSEHGTQELTNVSFDGKVLRFNAILGSNGKESFNFTLKCYGSVLLGESEADKGPSPVVAKALE